MVHSDEKQVVRRRDKERTRLALKQAAMKQIISEGIANFSIRTVCEQAGVSKGALFHHFPTRDILIAEAFSDMLKRFAEKLTQASLALRRGEVDLDEFLDRVLNVTQSDLFIGSMEISMAQRSNKDLKALVSEPVKEWRILFDQMWENTFDLEETDPQKIKAHWQMASNTLRGHAFSRTFGMKAATSALVRQGFQSALLKHATIKPI